MKRFFLRADRVIFILIALLVISLAVAGVLGAAIVQTVAATSNYSVTSSTPPASTGISVGTLASKGGTTTSATPGVTAVASPSPTAAPVATKTSTAVPTAPAREENVVQEVVRGTVHIVTDQGAGTGFKVRQQGSDSFIITNEHVIADAKQINVVTSDGVKHKASLLGKDRKADLAVLVVSDLASLPILKLRGGSAFALGEQLLVIGFPLSNTLGGEPTITRGIVSSHRSYSGIEYVQTDAAMNPGNSGGPVIDSKGEVIGVSVGIIRNVDDTPIEGINFAIAATTVQKVFERIAGQ